ncbi:MAG TPA: histidinol-phosphate transaminase [Saprospiraceae bacterium]|nr:histidinol-phosphate transaminase [Saprospiraceae bacterium]
MSMHLSRRDMLRSAMFAGAALPLVKFQTVLGKWREEEYAPIPDVSGTPVVRLSHNENPYGPSERARKALIAAIDKGNRYPRESMDILQQRIADYEGLRPEQILISAGSTELLGVAGLMSGIQKGKLIACHPTFPFLMQYATQFAAEWVKVPMTSDHHYNLAGINEQLDSHTSMVFICNPNNPTGTELPRTMLEPFCTVISERCLVYVDEAYIELSAQGLKSSLASLTFNNRNMIIGRTFSKIYGMAGLRVGYAIAHPETIQHMERLMMGGNVTPSVTSVEAAIASIGDEEFFHYCIEMNDQAKEMVYTKFKSWGVEYIPSFTNFVFFKTDRFGSTDILSALEQKNIMIRTYGDVPGWARVSMGTLDEMKVFLNATEELLV